MNQGMAQRQTPSETRAQAQVASAQRPASQTLARLAARCDAVCFGTLGQRSSESGQTIRRFVAATPASALRIFDINLRPPHYSEDVIRESLALANVVKLNDDELPVLAAICGASGDESQALTHLARQFDLRLVALTRGPQGATLICGNEISRNPGIKVDVIDNDPLDLINRRAGEVAAFVCSCAGATPPLPDYLAQPFL